MNKLLFKRVLAIILTAAVFCTVFCSCGDKNEAGLILSVKPDSMLGKFISTSSKFDITTSSSTDKDSLSKALGISPSAKYTLDGSGSSFTLSFSSTLLPNTVYTFSSTIGGRTVYQWAFQTAQDFEIAEVTLPKDANDKTITFDFSYDSVENFEDNFSISPKISGNFKHDKTKWTFTSDKPFNPETTYTVTLSKKTSTSGGLTLKDDYRTSFTTPTPTGSYLSPVKDGKDYADCYTPNETPSVLLKSSGVKDKSVKAEVYKFGDFKAYMNAHKTYFEAPDFSDIDALLTSLTSVGQFDTVLDDYPSNSSAYTSSVNADKAILKYPTSYPAGYYIAKITVEKYTVYHVFQVSSLVVYSLTVGNTVSVWVNSVKTGKQLTDTEVLLDNAYDEKTNENGVAYFELSEDNVSSRYMIINDPDNSQTPYIGYISQNENYSEINTAANYNCSLFTDSDSYDKNGTVKIFGSVLPTNNAKVPSVKIAYDNREQPLTLDSNGAFTTEIELSGKFDKSVTFSLIVGDSEVSSKTVAVSSKSTEKTVEGTYLSADYSSNTLSLTASNISSKYESGAKYNESASKKYSTPVFDKSSANLKYTVTVYKNTRFTKSKSGKYYDDASGAVKDRYVYTRSNKKEKVKTISGTTANGHATVELKYDNIPQSGVYYSFVIEYIDRSGKKQTITVNNDWSSTDYCVESNERYSIMFDKTTNLINTDKIGGRLTKGDELISTGKVLLISSKVNAVSNYLFDSGSVSFNAYDDFAPKSTVYAAYFDGGRVYALNTSDFSFKSGNKSTLDVSTDKTSYAKGDNISINISASADSKGVALPVLIYVYKNGSKQILTDNTAYRSNMKTSFGSVLQQTSHYAYGVTYNINKSKNSVQPFSAKSITNDEPVYFDYVTTASNGTATVEIPVAIANEEYIITAVALSFDSIMRADCKFDTKLKSTIEISAETEIGVNDDFALDVICNAKKNDTLTTTADSTVGTSGNLQSTANTTNNANTAKSTENAAEAVTYTVNASLYRADPKKTEIDEKQKLQTIAQSANTGENCKINFGKLTSGEYIYKAAYTFGNEKRTVIGRVTVSAKNTTVYPLIKKLDETGVFATISSSNTLKAMVYDENYAELFELSAKLCNNKSNNLPSILAGIDAQKFFKSENINTDALKNYQSGGISYKPNGNADLTLSAAAAAVCPDYFDKDALADYFEKYASSGKTDEHLLGLFGLSALHRPVMNKLYEALSAADSYNARQKLYLALAFGFIGDFDNAFLLYDSITAKIDNNDEISIKIDGLDTNTATVLTCLISSKLNDEKSRGMINYLRNNTDSNKFSLANLAYAEFINGYVFLSNEQSSVTVITNSEEKSVKFKRSSFARIEIKPENIASTTLKSTDSAYVCFVYMLSNAELDNIK